MKKNNYAMMASVAVNKSLLKEYQTSYGRTVYLDKDSEFQIKLFNPTTETVAAEVFVNEKSLGEKIIIRPGQLIWLERYLDEAKKFRFDTYEVDASAEEVKQAIRNNGDIKVKFYKEKDNDYGYTIWKSNAPGYVYYDNNIHDIKCNISDLTCTTNDLVGSTYTSCTSNSAYLTKSGIPAYACSYSNSNSTMETGRVEKGGYSDQRFTTVDVDLERWPFATEEIKLLPKSQKPVYKEDLEKLYCPECGRKVKTKFKYCPFCGEKL